MTENEAIKAIENDLEWHSKELKPKYKEVLRFAIQALEEIQQYRAIGTVEEFKALKEKCGASKYIEKLVDTVAKTLVEAFENLTIEDVNMYQIGYNKAIDEFKDAIKAELNRFSVTNLDTCVLYDFMDRKAEYMKAGGIDG